jgi:hypothetical protein
VETTSSCRHAFDRQHFAAGLRGWVDALGILLYLPPVGWLLLAIGVVVPRLAHRLALAVLAFVCFAIPTWGHTVPPFSLFRGPLCWHSILHLPLAALANADSMRSSSRVQATVRRWMPGCSCWAHWRRPLLSARAIGWLAAGVAGVLLARLVRRDAGVALVLASALGGAWTWVPAAHPGSRTGTPRGKPTYPRIEERMADAAALRAACARPRDACSRRAKPGSIPCSATYRRHRAIRNRRAALQSALLDSAGLAARRLSARPRAARDRRRRAPPARRARCIVLPDDWGPSSRRSASRGRARYRRGAWRRCARAPAPSTVRDDGARDDARARRRAGARLRPEGASGRRRFAAACRKRRERGACGAAGARRVRVDATAPGGGYLVVSETWYPGWRALVDGVPAAVERADYAMIGVRLPPGARTVDLWYAPRGFAAARWATLAGMALLALTALGALRVRRRA